MARLRNRGLAGRELEPEERGSTSLLCGGRAGGGATRPLHPLHMRRTSTAAAAEHARRDEVPASIGGSAPVALGANDELEELMAKLQERLRTGWELRAV